jgi:hypothetical protein
VTMRPPHKRCNEEEEARDPKAGASNNQLHLTGNSFDPRTGLDGGGTAIVSGLTVGTSGQDINLNSTSTSITNGQTVTISTGTIRHTCKLDIAIEVRQGSKAPF